MYEGARSTKFRILKKINVTVFDVKGAQIRAQDTDGKKYTRLEGAWRERNDNAYIRAWTLTKGLT
jgi:hypothetical protein